MKLGNQNIEIKATPNYSARTFTIRKEITEKDGRTFKNKYRTDPMNKDEFEMHLSSTTIDWLNFFKYSQCYHFIKCTYPK